MRCRRRSRHPPTPHSPPAMPVRCPPTPTSGRAALSSPCPSRRSSLLQRHHLRPLLACRGEPRAERLDVAHPTREALDSTRPDTEEVARIHGPQLARAARERRSRWPDHRRLRVLATELDPPWHPRNALEGGRSIHLSYWRGRPIWSGRADSNGRPPAPKAGALPGCATPRQKGPDSVTRTPGPTQRWRGSGGGESGAERAHGARPVAHPLLVGG